MSDRDRRAATDRMYCYPDDPAAGPEEVAIYSGGRRYLVHARWGCPCGDATHRSPDGGCKHMRRLAFELGVRTVPEVDGIDPLLGEQLPDLEDER